MMRKKIVSLCMALTLCLALLPVTALAADGIELYVGGQQITESGCYANQNGTWTKVGSAEPASGQFYYDAATATLTLNQAKISYDKTLALGTKEYYGSVIAYSPSADVSLNIVVSQGTSTIMGTGGIRVMSEAGDASLSISGPGSLEVKNVSNDSGIVLIGSKNVNLGINSADVTISDVQYYGVNLAAGDECKSTATINDGNLTASGSTVGIYFMRLYNDGPSSLTVSGNAMVDTEGSTGGIINGSPDSFQIGADGESGGIVFNGKNGTVYGDVTLQDDLTINEGETLTIPEDATLTVPEGTTLTNNGTVTTEEGGTLTGTITGNQPPKITTASLPNGTVNEEYNQTLAATGSDTITWSIADGSSLPAGLSLDENTITGTPTAAGTYNFTVKAESSYGSDSKQLSIIIDAQTNVPVTGVTLNKTSTELTVGQSETLTATITPDNTTNKNVTWSSDKPEVAKVENGIVTAVSAGTATITVTTADGNKTATCTVTVTRPYIPPANPNYRITVEATQGGAVTADPTAAKAGTTVTLTPVPDRGYQVGTVAVTDRFGDAVGVTEQADGTYTFTMPNGQVTVTVTFAETPLPFTDVTEGDWFYDAVRYAYETGLMDGVGDGQFAPNATTNRAMVVTILYRLAGEPAVAGQSDFTDVADGLWYTDAVLWAAQKGIVNGISATEFAPAGDLTREQLATILFRYAESMDYDVSASADLSGFPDADQIQSYATEALSWAVAEGLLQGFEDDSLQPGGTATRAQIATILMRFLSAAPTA